MLVSSSSEWDESGTAKIVIHEYLSDGFTVNVTGITQPTYVTFSYFGI